uniref:Uncharacterized protein n=1 Tax=Magallana gigas TaxID=29159 RepID=A0A8W8IMC0_MAGGI
MILLYNWKNKLKTPNTAWSPTVEGHCNIFGKNQFGQLWNQFYNSIQLQGVKIAWTQKVALVITVQLLLLFSAEKEKCTPLETRLKGILGDTKKIPRSQGFLSPRHGERSFCSGLPVL